MGVKRIIGLALTLVLVVGGVIFLRQRAGQGDSGKLQVLTWSNYFPDSVLKDFAKKTGIKVELSYMSSNEELFAKLRAGATGFDIIQPSDYMVRRLKDLSMIREIDHSLLPHLSHLDPYYTTLPYDPGLKFSVPFTWGTTGIAINHADLKMSPETVSWALLFDSPDPRHTSLLDDMREVFAAVLKWRGYSINERDMKALLAAKADIARAKDKILTFSSEIKPLLVRDEIRLAHAYSVDALQAAKDNPKVKYVIPKEGGTIWTDNFAIPVSSPHAREAHLFLDYLLDPKNAVAIIRENCLATPNKSARLMLTPEEQADPNLYPPKEVIERLEFLEDAGDILPEINRMWTELKS